MENIIDKYFEIARTSELPISIEQIEKSLAIIAITPHVSAIQKLLTKNNIIMTSISGIIISASVVLFSIFSNAEKKAEVAVGENQPEITIARNYEKISAIKSICAESVQSSRFGVPVLDPIAIRFPVQIKAIRDNHFKTKPDLPATGQDAESFSVSTIENPDTIKDASEDKMPIEETNISEGPSKSTLTVYSNQPDTIDSKSEQVNQPDVKDEDILNFLDISEKDSRGYDKYYGFCYNDERWAKVKIDGKFGMIDTNSKWVVPPIYDKIECFCNNHGIWAKVKNNGKWGFIDNTGKEVVPTQYKKVWDFCENSGNWAKVKRNRRYFFIDKNGNEVYFEIPTE
ncbi:MAG: WG repeat-containing protein [Bacteroidota bacterium]|nr:WG repeat-containing protein [Bacteroidota bacterium]